MASLVRREIYLSGFINLKQISHYQDVAAHREFTHNRVQEGNAMI